MCRLVAYVGPEILLEDVLVKPINSIVMQSLHARESTIPTNGDGFGLGWYSPQISAEPALFISIFPAWNDSNLLHLTAKIKSPCFFAHVRAASVGGINNYNCHPFIHGRWMLMHNGQIQDFIAVKRHLRHLLDDDIYHWIQGETDSEHIFALFLQMAKGRDLSKLNVVADTLEATLKQVIRLVAEYGRPGSSYFNICLTDGQQIVASRYSTDDSEPESLYYMTGKDFGVAEHNLNQKSPHKDNFVIVTSERLNDFSKEWEGVPANCLLMVDKDRNIQLRPLLKGHS